MNRGNPPFKRIVLEFKRGSHNAEAIQLAAELAELFQVDLLGRFVEDSGLAQLARTPFAREFRMLEGEWRDLDSQSAAGSVELAIAAARRLFMQAVASSPVSRDFEVLRAEASAEQRPSAQELVAVVQDPDTGEEIFLSRLGVSQGDTIGVLLLPRQKARHHGPIVVIAATEDEPSVAIAAQVAAAAREMVLRLDWPPDPSWGSMANARLVVVTASRFCEIAPHTTTILAGVPILILGNER